MEWELTILIRRAMVVRVRFRFAMRKSISHGQFNGGRLIFEVARPIFEISIFLPCWSFQKSVRSWGHHISRYTKWTWTIYVSDKLLKCLVCPWQKWVNSIHALVHNNQSNSWSQIWDTLYFVVVCHRMVWTSPAHFPLKVFSLEWLYFW